VPRHTKNRPVQPTKWHRRRSVARTAVGVVRWPRATGALHLRGVFEGALCAEGMGGGMRRIAGAIVVAVLLVVLGAVTVTAQETADLQITKVAGSRTVRVGETVTYTVTLTNLGPGVATGVVFGDSLPDQLNLVESTCGSVSAFCSLDTLPPGASATLTIVATPITNLARNERRISNTAFVAESATTDPDLSNNQASTIVRMVGPL
jgi:uncharacterized repeat protein (TIGR01451 family)